VDARVHRLTVAIGVLALLAFGLLVARHSGRSSNDAGRGISDRETPAAPPTVSADAGSADLQASGGVEPTTANTGPTSPPPTTMRADQFLRSGTCRDARILDQVYVQEWSDIAAWDRTFTIDNCVLEGGFYWLVDDGGDYPVDSYPTITITRTDILGSMVLVSPARLRMERSYVSAGAMWAPCADCAGPRFGLARAMPVTVRNSLFVHPQGSPPEHTEALHVAGSGQGYRFVNTRFVQWGPFNGTQTAALFFHGGASTFESCWFGYREGPAAYYTVYVYGRGPGATSNVVRNSAIENGRSFYVYDVAAEGLEPAAYVGNRDLRTGRQIL
jgi:hypothetical protein